MCRRESESTSLGSLRLVEHFVRPAGGEPQRGRVGGSATIPRPVTTWASWPGLRIEPAVYWRGRRSALLTELEEPLRVTTQLWISRLEVGQ